jgi:hypothetical protein
MSQQRSSTERSSKIFINYRREDSAGHAGRLFDRLGARFPGRVFMDIDTLEPGVDFVEVIETAVGSCEVLIVLIGHEWLSVKDAAGHRRLDDPADYVRLEVATALQRRIRVIPVLVQSASMPRAEELPPDLATLARRNAIELSDARWAYDVDRLIRTIEEVLEGLELRPTGAVDGASAERAEPAPPVTAGKAARPRARMALIAAVLVAGIAGVGWWMAARQQAAIRVAAPTPSSPLTPAATELERRVVTPTSSAPSVPVPTVPAASKPAPSAPARSAQDPPVLVSSASVPPAQARSAPAPSPSGPGAQAPSGPARSALVPPTQAPSAPVRSDAAPSVLDAPAPAPQAPDPPGPIPSPTEPASVPEHEGRQGLIEPAPAPNHENRQGPTYKPAPAPDPEVGRSPIYKPAPADHEGRQRPVYRPAPPVDHEIRQRPSYRPAPAPDQESRQHFVEPPLAPSHQGESVATGEPGYRRPTSEPARRFSGATPSGALAPADPRRSRVAAAADTCKPGFVWRLASRDDHVCVTSATRQQAAEDNRLAAVRRNPQGGPYGVNTCRTGYVWREAFANDLVCVTPGTRRQTLADNAAASERLAPR